MDRIWARVCADLHIVIPCSLAESRILDLILASIDQKENTTKKKLLGSCIHIFVLKKVTKKESCLNLWKAKRLTLFGLKPVKKLT